MRSRKTVEKDAKKCRYCGKTLVNPFGSCEYNCRDSFIPVEVEILLDIRALLQNIYDKR